MVDIARLANRKAAALISDMNQPLGIAVGNILEVKEAIATLQGRGPVSFLEHCLDVAEQMLVLGNTAKTTEEARRMSLKALQDGSAMQHFLKLVDAQGGDVSYVKDPGKFPQSPVIKKVLSPESGYLSQIHARIVGETAVDLGAGREKKGDPIDHTVGIEILKEVGDYIEKGQELFVIHGSTPSDVERAEERLLDAHRWSDQRVKPFPLVYEIIN
jgi:pyrimidine-nucleoside phosphorylase